ncbi:MAG: hypothetical protein NVS84_01065 [Candidatus Carsonella ruddii]|nr:MAG: hypothetical protein NVS84_01065 [Candidatus Carsonella ruddii]WMC19450.1 MAG: hypothetical protein NVS85_01065 [Candidatus Carsonella ruddii]
MSYVYNLYKKIISLKEKKVFLILCLLTIHFYVYNIKTIIIYNLIFQLILQIIFFLKINSLKKKIYILILLFFFFTILILFLGIKWITLNSCK